MTAPTLAPFDRSAGPYYRLRNAVQTVLLLGSMIALLAACGWAVAGTTGLIWAAILGGIGVGLSARVSPGLALRMMGGQPLLYSTAPDIHAIVQTLAERAELGRAPNLFYIPSPVMTAFSIGNRDHAAVAVSSGLLRQLSPREVMGVLAHEISHIRHNDPWIMALANMVRSLTGTMSFLGIMLLFLNLPLVVSGTKPVPWLLVLLLTFAPTIGALLQLALSRTREFDADLDAAGMTGDPIGLATALEKLERQEGRNWEAIVPGGRRGTIPTLLRTHPKTEERVARLLALRGHRPIRELRIPVEEAPHARSIIPDSPRRQPWPWRVWGPWG